MKNIEKVKLNIKQCEEIGKILKSLKFRHSFYKREFITFKADRESKLRVYLFSVAICHQTHSLINKKRNLKGWDFIEYVYLYLAKNKSELLDPDYLAEVSTNDLIKRLRIVFSDDNDPKNCTLDRLQERAKLLIEIGKIIKQKYGSKVENLISLSNGYLIDNGKGLYELLDQFEAFTDPFKKKSTLFIKYLIETNLFRVKDPENFIPIMDYHMQRVLLRMGCIDVVDRKLRQKLLNKIKVESDKDIRNACVEAVKFINKISGYEITKMNDIFWTLGRSCCHITTLCADRICSKSPCTFYSVVILSSHKKCIFKGTCKGSVDSEYRKFWQPIVNTHYY